MSHPTYWNVLDQISNCRWTVHKLAHLEDVRDAIRHFWPEGHPTRFIQVAGTNGKGTVCRFLEACFSTVGTVGTLTSPHLFDYRERFTVNGQPVSAQDVTDAWENQILPFCIEATRRGKDSLVSYPLIYILMSLVFFEKFHVEWGIMETGLGGRYDQVTALDVEAVVLTNVGNDHTHILGANTWQRVLDKSGICRKGRPFFTADEKEENRNIMREICNASAAPFFYVGASEVAEFSGLLTAIPAGGRFTVQHNLRNGALSLAVAQYLLHQENKPLDVHAACQRMDRVEFAGRFYKIEPQIYIDIAHNADKISALVDHIKADQTVNKKRKILLLGLSRQRDPIEVLAPILAVANSIIVTSTPNEGVAPDEIVRALSALAHEGIKIQAIAEPKDALAEARRELDENSVIIATGSTFMIDQLFNPDDPIRELNRLGDWRSAR